MGRAQRGEDMGLERRKKGGSGVCVCLLSLFVLGIGMALAD